MRPLPAFQRSPLTASVSSSFVSSNPRAAKEQQRPIRQRKYSSSRPTLARSSLDPSSSSTTPSSSSSSTSFSTFTVDLKVRDSELDQFLVVNNANYSVYLQHARHEFLERIGLPVAAATEEGGALALSRLVLDFRAPLRSGDTARVGVRVVSTKGARVEMKQWVDAVRRGEGKKGAEAGTTTTANETGTETETETITRALDAEATVVALDGRYRPTRLSAVVQRALETGEKVPEGTRWFSGKGGSGSASASGSSSFDDSD